ncbi:MAG: sarcosine oxidase subunit gamma [Methylovirgula sp.]
MSDEFSMSRNTELVLEISPHYYKCGRRGATLVGSGVTLQLIANEDRFVIEARRGKTAAFLAALENAFGSAPVDGPRTIVADGFEFLGIGPSRWHGVSRGQGRDARRSALHGATVGLATVVDVSHGFAVFRLAGPMAAEALIRLARLDLDPTAFADGACATTELHGMSVQLRRTCDGAAYECAVSRSFGSSLFHALAQAADPYGLSVETPE